jgi:hypothetical protein
VQRQRVEVALERICTEGARLTGGLVEAGESRERMWEIAREALAPVSPKKEP